MLCKFIFLTLTETDTGVRQLIKAFPHSEYRFILKVTLKKTDLYGKLSQQCNYRNRPTERG